MLFRCVCPRGRRLLGGGLRSLPGHPWEGTPGIRGRGRPGVNYCRGGGGGPRLLPDPVTKSAGGPLPTEAFVRASRVDSVPGGRGARCKQRDQLLSTQETGAGSSRPSPRPGVPGGPRCWCFWERPNVAEWLGPHSHDEMGPCPAKSSNFSPANVPLLFMLFPEAVTQPVWAFGTRWFRA